MSNRRPRTYDEITRATVPEPDSSWRPSVEQEREAYRGFRFLDDMEKALLARITTALATSGEDVKHVSVDVDGSGHGFIRDEHGHVTLRGRVQTAVALARILDIVRGVDGVTEIDDQLVIAAH